MNRQKNLQSIFLFALFAFMFVLLVRMMYPFFTVFLWTVLLYILIRPLYAHCTEHLDKNKKTYSAKRALLAGVFSLATLILIIGPLSMILTMLVRQMISFLQTAETFIRNNPDFFNESDTGKYITALISKITMNSINLNTMDIRAQLLQLVSQYSNKLFSVSTSVISGAGNFVVSVMFVIFALYFCFLDGKYLASLLVRAIPINPDYMTELAKKFTQITRNLFSGYILVALYQGIASFILMSLFGIQGALLFSVALMFASFIPLFGAAIVWVPAGIVLIATDGLAKGLLFLVLAGICISLLDNFLRPFFLKDRIHVHPLVIFFSILGGLQMFGLNGLLLGPAIVILFFSVLDMLSL